MSRKVIVKFDGGSTEYDLNRIYSMHDLHELRKAVSQSISDHEWKPITEKPPKWENVLLLINMNGVYTQEIGTWSGEYNGNSYWRGPMGIISEQMIIGWKHLHSPSIDTIEILMKAKESYENFRRENRVCQH